MKEPQFLIEFIKRYRRKMNLALLFDWCALTITVGAFVALLAEVTALLIPFYYANLIALLCVVTGLLCGIMIACLKHHSMKEAALAIDRSGFEERIITAYENLDRQEEIIELQRNDALLFLKQHQDMVKQKLLPSWKRLLPMAVLSLMVLLAAWIPSEKKELAAQQHELAQQAQEKQDEIREALEALEEIDTSDMTEEQIAQLTAMADALEASMTEMKEISQRHFSDAKDALASSTAMAQANERLDYKMQNISQQLNQMSQQALLGQGNPTLAENLQNAANQVAASQSGGSQEAGSGQSQSSNSVQAGGGQSPSSNSAQAGGGQSPSGNSAQAGGGQSPSGNNAQGNQGQAQNGNQNGGAGQNGNGGGAQGGQSGQNGQNGQNGGNGAGTGSSSNPHDYVSVPNALGNDETLHGNSTESDQSEYYREQNGLAWEGEHVSYESVIGNYTQQAYEGLEQGRYPSGMTDVIRDYFGGLQ